MKRVLSFTLAFLMLFSVFSLSYSGAYAASKTYAQDKLVEIQKTAGFIPGKDAAVLNNCYGFISKVCEKLFGVSYNGEGLYENYKAKHSSGNFKTVATFTTPNKTPTSADVEGIISFFLKYAAPGDVIHYGAYDKNVSKTHTVMIQSIDNHKMSVYHSNYNIAQNSRSSCHIDDFYWDSFRKNPTSHVKNSDGTLYSLNAMFYNTMKVGGIGITINRYSKYEEKFYLVGAAVPAVKTERSGSTSIKVKWDEIIGAKKYQVQFKKSSDSSFTTLTTNCTELSYDVKNLTVGVSYDFRVAAYIGTKWMNFSDTVSKSALPPTLTVIKFTPESDGLSLSWTKRSDITGIRIYKSESADGTFSKVKTITDNSIGTYLDKKITYGKKYYYKIERYVTYNKKEYKTTSSAISGAYELKQPKVTYKNINASSVEITLEASGKNDKFNYYLTDSNSKNVVPLTKTEETKITLENLKVGAQYNFNCRQSTTIGSGEYTSLTLRAIPKKEAVSSVAATSKGVRIKYTPCDDVDGYCILRSTSQFGTYSLVGTVEDRAIGEFSDTSVKYGTEYYYKVRSFVNADGEKVYSDYSDASSKIKITLSKPTEVTVTRKTPTSMTLKWKAVKNAEKYTVQYKAEGDKSWQTLSDIKGTSKVVSKLTLGKNYYFRVKAVNTIGSGAYSSQVSKKALPPTPAAPTLKNTKSGVRVYWKEKEWTTGYKIYRATSKNGTYSLIKTINNPKTTAWTDTSVKKNKGYYYKTVCFVTKSKKTHNSPKSSYTYIKHTR